MTVTKPRVLVMANQKGGVGKTTTAINLGTALAATGHRTLIIDLDPQGNASTGLGIERRNRDMSTFHVLIGQSQLQDVIIPTSIPNLNIAPSTLDLLGAEALPSDNDRLPSRSQKLGAAGGHVHDEPRVRCGICTARRSHDSEQCSGRRLHLSYR